MGSLTSFRVCDLRQRFAELLRNAEDFMELLGQSGVVATDYPPLELEDELRTAL